MYSQVMDYDGISKNVTAVGFCETGKWMYTGGEDGTARIWDLRCTDCIGMCGVVFEIHAKVLK